MFARVITAQVSEDGLEALIRSADQELPDARRRPGFAGYFLLTDSGAGDAIIISLWQTRADMEAIARGTAAGIRQGATPETVLESLHLRIYEVAVQA